MKILLISPQYIHSNEFDSRAPAMSLFYLASSLEQAGHQVTIFDASLGPIERNDGVFYYGVPDQEIDKFLAENSFDIAGIACPFTARWKFTSRLAKQVKNKFPNIPIAIGGLFPSSEWKYCLNNCPEVDFAMLGEAEISFVQIVNNLKKGLNLHESCKDVEGVAWRVNGEIYCNPKLGYNNQLDELPFPAWHLIELKKYFRMQRSIFELPTPCLPILSSRGCPYSCRFCNMYITHGHRWRARSVKNILDEIDYLNRKFNVHHYYFIDDNFSFDLERAKLICQGIIDRDYKIKYNFHNGLSIKTIDREFVQLLKKSGCTSVCLAIESGSERVRNEIYRKMLSTQKIFEVFNWFKEARIPTIGYFMVGGPGETRNDFEESKKLLAKLPMSLATVGIFTPYPGTELYDECKKKGWLVEPDIEDAGRVEMFLPMLRTPDFEPDDVGKWQKELYISFIKHHWPTLIKESLRPLGVVNFDMLGKFFGMLNFRRENQKNYKA